MRVRPSSRPQRCLRRNSRNGHRRLRERRARRQPKQHRQGLRLPAQRRWRRRQRPQPWLRRLWRQPQEGWRLRRHAAELPAALGRRAQPPQVAPRSRAAEPLLHWWRLRPPMPTDPDELLGAGAAVAAVATALLPRPLARRLLMGRPPPRGARRFDLEAPPHRLGGRCCVGDCRGLRCAPLTLVGASMVRGGANGSPSVSMERI
mmetsp:Transcript_386/g.1071  ORF Transcript_386/g.1071 Transcript_386/m.1071 type:complete len:204 (-) Transcript_386:24-635(-)